jgi:hypothetical protein
MTDQEAEEIYRDIIENLKQRQFSNIISMIEKQIAEGKIVEDEVKTFRETFGVVQNILPAFESEDRHLKPSGKGSFSTIIPYTSKERLGIAVNIIVQTLFAPLEIREYLRTSFLERYALRSLEFHSSTGDILVRISQQDQRNHDQTDFTNHMKRVLDMLKKEV